MRNLKFISYVRHPNITRLHSHSVTEVVYYLDCEGELYIENETYCFRPGSIIIVPPYHRHYETSDTNMTIACFGVQTLLNLEEGILQLNDNSKYNFINLFKQLYAANRIKYSNWKKIQDALLHLMEQYIIGWSSQDDNDNEIVQILKQKLIDSIPQKNVSIEKIETDMPISNSYLRKIFKKETGMSPMEYLQLQRINNAKQLLANTSLNIKSIAINTGFEDPYYFSRLFKRVTGKSPSDWRRYNKFDLYMENENNLFNWEEDDNNDL